MDVLLNFFRKCSLVCTGEEFDFRTQIDEEFKKDYLSSKKQFLKAKL